MSPDYTLYLVTDRDLSRGRSLDQVVREAVEGGVRCVQIREKRCDTREFLHWARALLVLLRPLGIPLIVNDRVDVALAAGADGVHLGQQDMTLTDARRLGPSGWIIGVSAESVGAATRAEKDGADYIGASPVFSTPTKTDIASPLGLDGLRDLRVAVRVPLIGIGGIHAGNAREVIRAGADGVAVVSALMAAESPREAARMLRQELDLALVERRKK
ncbi:MAG: thiamine phosphate synthase [Kiritimatiellia bacterium]|nr:thiamine phosphate synthase [Kiritimatiellia bacterium]